MKIKTISLLFAILCSVFLTTQFAYSADNSTNSANNNPSTISTDDNEDIATKADKAAKKSLSDIDIDSFTPTASTAKNNQAKKEIKSAEIVAYNPPLQALTAMITKGIYTVDVLFDATSTRLTEDLTDSAKHKLDDAQYVVIFDHTYNLNIINYLKLHNPNVKVIAVSNMTKLQLSPPKALFLNLQDPLLHIGAIVKPTKIKPKAKTNAELMREAEALLDQAAPFNYTIKPSGEENPKINNEFINQTNNDFTTHINKSLEANTLLTNLDYNFYLNPNKSITFLKELRDYFIYQNKNFRVTYTNNYNTYRKILRNLDNEIQNEIYTYAKHDVIFYSNNWQYFQLAYKIKQHLVILTESPNKAYFHKVTPNELNTLNTYVNKNKITCIFTETQFDDLLLQKYIKEKNLRTAELSYTGYNLKSRSAISNYLYMLKYNSTIFSYCSN